MSLSPSEVTSRIDTLLTHVWMVRTFLKHCDEAEEDAELAEVHRTLYDYMLALGAPTPETDPVAYLRQANKKLKKLQRANDLFQEIQPEISDHTNFRMAARSLATAVEEIAGLLAGVQGSGIGSQGSEMQRDPAKGD